MHRTLVLAAALGAAVSLTACGAIDTGTGSTAASTSSQANAKPAACNQPRPYLAVALANLTNPYYLAMKQGFVDDSLKLYKGPLKDNEGNVILKEGEVIANDDNKFKLAVNFLVEGAVGKTGLKK